MSIASFLNLNGLVETPAAAKNAIGGVTKTWSTLIAVLPCTLARRSLTETDSRGKRTMRNVLRLYCEVTTAALTITEDDRITISSIEYLVETIYNPGVVNQHLEINVVRIG